MTNASEEQKLFEGYNVGGGLELCVSHLQFAYDTMILGAKSWSNIRNIKANLLMFELASWLKVKFHKSLLVGVNVHEYWLEEAATLINCKKGMLPFKYLVLPIGDNPQMIDGVDDIWIWSKGHNNEYVVKEVYQMLVSIGEDETHPSTK
ncbi:uncharacterized protein, partial [Cicer arietinum]|uniref:uncharacterized protein n=1 Tax=Cicer arietinum TaxID=3827 RepID=UPI003CC53EBC